MAFITDNFTETNDTALGSHTPDSGGTWTEKFSSSGMTVVGSEDKVRGNSDSATSTFYHSASPASNEYDVQATCSFVTGSDNGSPGVAGRLASTASFYTAILARLTRPFGGIAYLEEVNNGSIPTSASWANSFAFSTDYVVKLELRNGTNGVKMYVDGTQRAQITPSAVTATGKAGIIGRLYGRIDSFTGTDVSSTTDGVGSSSGTFTVSGVGASNRAAAGSSSGTFSLSGVGASNFASAGSSSGTFTASGVGNAITDTVGTITLNFTAVGDGSFASGSEGVGATSVTFSASGVAISTHAASGSSAVSFNVSGASPVTTEAVGSSSLTFEAQGYSPETERPRTLEGGHEKKRRRFILPDNTIIEATTQEVYEILDRWVKPKKKKKQVVKLLDKIEIQEEKIEKKVYERVVIKPVAFWQPDKEKYDEALKVIKRRRQLTEILLLAA